ncbi:MAG: acyltransferase family protein [Actinomycetota bacterium]
MTRPLTIEPTPDVPAAPPVGHTATALRADIQALRALAVAVVVVFHVWPDVLPGGFVGVDVFFVISGFLITGHLVREVDRSGRVALAQFWARRAVRLLPASLTVLAASLIAIVLWVPKTLWDQFLGSITASVLYVVNWRLASDSVDYLAAENVPSPVQHFWSLSVEEQFYVVWPVVVLGAVLVAARLGLARRAAIVGVLGAIVAASFVFSVWFTRSDPSQAYFVTPTRAWEFGLGALLALVPAVSVSAVLRRWLGWAAVVVIVVCAFTYGAVAFPGWIAVIPCAATIVALALDSDDAPRSIGAAGRIAPIRFLGAASYSLYLWHWPFIVLYPYAVGSDLGSVSRWVVLVLSVVAAWASLRLIEDPVRHHPRVESARPAVLLLATVGAMALVLGGVGLARAELDRELESIRTAEQAALDAVEQAAEEAGEVGSTPLTDCRGAAALDPDLDCPTNAEGVALVPSPLTAVDDVLFPVCMAKTRVSELRVCEVGVPAETATATVAVIGDSHARHWRGAIEHLAEQEGWRVLVMLKGSCPFNSTSRATDNNLSTSCDAWNENVHRELESRDDVTAIFVSASSLNRFQSDDDDSLAAGAAGYLETWSRLPESIEHVIALRDIPRPQPDNLECVQESSPEQRIEPGRCSRAAVDALLPDPMEVAALRADVDPRVRLVDLNHLFCEDDRCLVVVGNTTIYRDGHHMTASFARSLAPYLAAELPTF